MANISAGVGEGQRNIYGDVKAVQVLLNKNKAITTPTNKLVEDGAVGARTIQRIKEFQQKVVGLKDPDGIISPNGPTMRKLVVNSSFHTTTKQTSRNVIFTEDQLVHAAKRIGCEVAAIKAVVLTETPLGAFDEKGRPTILYERHYFHNFTGGKYDSDPALSNKKRGGYGKYSEQYGKLNKAIELDKSAALKSASWGAFQIMGSNFKSSGYGSVEDFVKGMDTIQGQLDAFVSFIINNPVMKNAIINKNWSSFAKSYNGPKYKENNYDTVLNNNYLAALKGL